ncbi:hypothetical protein HMPREF1545_02027 [Oscillibacter sp. KLE 1728]|nr:hypothetical protein HMPREF1546_03963 [Oscillibacter sp. KLE 1745]ERK60465.1 hypothetical protein HMPREF1545_02027 [Oscillibacter sp. KLE 1728]
MFPSSYFWYAKTVTHCSAPCQEKLALNFPAPAKFYWFDQFHPFSNAKPYVFSPRFSAKPVQGSARPAQSSVLRVPLFIKWKYFLNIFDFKGEVPESLITGV